MLKKIVTYCFLCLVIQLYGQTISTSDSTIIYKANTYLKLLQQKYYEGNYKLHKVYSDSLLEISKEHKLKAMQIKAMVNQGINFNLEGVYNKSITLYKEALALAKEDPRDAYSEVLVLVNLGNLYNNVELYGKAIDAMNQVLKQVNDAKRPKLVEVAALNGLSKSYSSLNKEKEALNYSLRVKKIGEETKNENIILSSLNHISNSYYKLGEYDKAVEEASKAFNYKAFEKDTRIKAWLLVNIGVAKIKLAAYDEAEKIIQQALNIASKKNIGEIKMICYENLMLIYKQLEKKSAYSQVEKKYNEARIDYLKNQKKAITQELRTEIVAREKTELAKKNVKASFSQHQKTILWFSVFCVVGLAGLFWIFLRKNNKAEKPNLKTTNQKGILASKKYKNSSLSKEKRSIYKQKILQAIEEEKVYLNHDLTQASFAKQLGLSSHHLSEVLSLEFDTNFYQLINSYRIKEAKNILASSTNNTKILAVAYDAGFKSKTTFNRVFKEQTGATPSEYKKKMKK